MEGVFTIPVRSGRISNKSSRLWDAGAYSYTWSKRAYHVNTHSCLISISANAVNFGANEDRFQGFPLRCLARQYIIYIQA